MDLQEYNIKIQQLAAKAKEKAMAMIFVPAASELLANTKNRIIQEGKKADGGQIGSYSTKETYVELSQFIVRSAFKPQGKNTVGAKGKARTVKPDGTPRKTMYLANGYKELREIQGRPTEKVNLFYRGDLMLSYVQQNEPAYILLGLDKESEAKKREGLEKKFGEGLLQPSDEDLEIYQRQVTEGVKALQIALLK